MIKPTKDRVVILQDTTEKQIGSIIIPDSAIRKINIGTVIEIGNEVEEVQKGDKVVFKKNAGTENDGHLIIREEDILGILL